MKGMPSRYVPSGGRNAAGAGGQPRDCTVTLAFVSKNSFAATSSFPPKEVSDAYKMNMGRWEPDAKRWTFHLEQYDKLDARLESICRTRIAGFNLSFKRIPDAIMRILRVAPGRCAPAETHSNEAQMLFEKLPPHLRLHLMEFQREGVLFGLATNGRVLIGDEMGLGKTVQAIAIASAYKSDWPLLVVCPSSLRSMWAQEILRWLDGLVSVEDVNVLYTSKDPISKCAVPVISYDLFAKLQTDIAQQGFQVVINHSAPNLLLHST